MSTVTESAAGPSSASSVPAGPPAPPPAVTWSDTDIATLFKRIPDLEKHIKPMEVIVDTKCHPDDYHIEWLRGAAQLQIIQYGAYVHSCSFYVPSWNVYFMPDRSVKVSKQFPDEIAGPLVDWLAAG
jgi:hypothetical protein